MRRTLISLTCTLALLPMAQACINDRDSDALAEEARQLPELTQVLTGRFERNPPRYYEMRLARVRQELAKDPTKLALYDDAAAAADRLHHSDEAIAWMAKKQPYLKADKEATYRYHANLGTFLAHRWIGRKNRWEHLSEMKEARDHIARAIEIKPDAHFNRERYQLQIMDWILTKPLGVQKALKAATEQEFRERPKTLYHALDDFSQPTELTRRVEGLAGIIVLGAAWESVDVANALAGTLGMQGHNKLARLAALRRDELLKAGKHSLMFTPGDGDGEQELLRDESHGPQGGRITIPEGVEAKFTELRREADAWQKARTAYMETRFAQGRHPDTDPDFWNDWKPAPPPSLEIPGEEEARRAEQRTAWINRNAAWLVPTILLSFFGLLSAGVYGIALWVKRRLRR